MICGPRLLIGAVPATSAHVALNTPVIVLVSAKLFSNSNNVALKSFNLIDETLIIFDGVKCNAYELFGSMMSVIVLVGVFNVVFLNLDKLLVCSC